MAITFPLALPAVLEAASIRWIGQSAVGGGPSPFTFKQQLHKHSGKMLEIEITTMRLERADAEQVVTFGLKLGGKLGTFLIGDLPNPNPRGSSGGTPLVKGAGQTGEELIIDGLPVSTNGVYLAGDWFHVGTGTTQRLHKNLVDVDSNGAGDATLDIFPPLRESPVDDAPLTWVEARGVFRLVNNAFTWDLRRALVYGFQFVAVEAI